MSIYLFIKICYIYIIKTSGCDCDANTTLKSYINIKQLIKFVVIKKNTELNYDIIFAVMCFGPLVFKADVDFANIAIY